MCGIVVAWGGGGGGCLREKLFKKEGRREGGGGFKGSRYVFHKNVTNYQRLFFLLLPFLPDLGSVTFSLLYETKKKCLSVTIVNCEVRFSPIMCQKIRWRKQCFDDICVWVCQAD